MEDLKDIKTRATACKNKGEIKQKIRHDDAKTIIHKLSESVNELSETLTLLAILIDEKSKKKRVLFTPDKIKNNSHKLSDSEKNNRRYNKRVSHIEDTNTVSTKNLILH